MKWNVEVIKTYIMGPLDVNLSSIKARAALEEAFHLGSSCLAISW